MPKAYPDDVREAVLEALSRFENREHGDFIQHFEVGTVTVMFAIRRAEDVSERWDYGHPAMYVLDTGFLPELDRWWQEVAPTGALLPPAFKAPINAWEVNFVCDLGSRRFNYHVAVP